MWTYSGILIHKENDRKTVYASNKHELEMFTNEGTDQLHDFFRIPEIKDDGLYVAMVGYGDFQDPTVYICRKIAELDWNEIDKLIHDLEYTVPPEGQ